jgi:hypothetical protein
MARSNGRWGRLRRVLNEDLSNSSAVYGTGENDRTPGDTPRYGAGANIENHPQVTDYVPRRYRMMGSILAGGIVLGLVSETVAHHAEALSATFGTTAVLLTDILSNRLIGWTSAMALIVAAAYARIIYLLKRHRLDDLRGRYRVWRTGSLLAVAVSACCVTGAHTLLGSAMAHITGWSNSAGWWLVPSAVVGAWVLCRLILDATECRTALAMFVVAAMSFATAAACSAGWSLTDSPLWTETLTRSLPLAGCLGILAGTLFTARYVVLDVQGLIEHEPVQVKPSKAKTASRKVEESTAPGSATDDDETSWTDGTEPDYDYGDDDRPLSKAERKRLRKQQGRFRAA